MLAAPLFVALPRTAAAQSNDPPAPTNAAPLPAPPPTAAPAPESPRVEYTPVTPATPPPFVPESETASDNAPPARSGFQMAIRTGYSLPMGSSSGAAGDDLSKAFGGHVPVMLDLGGKVSDHVFLGAYLGMGFGSAGSNLDSVCGHSAVTCLQASLRIGAELQYHFAPEAKTNPWIGYGIGYESTAVAANGPGGTASFAAAGPEYARLMGGIDFRVSRGFGIGPYADFTLGQYSTAVAKDVKGKETTTDITNTALHQWLTLGVRFVVFP